MTKSKSYDKFVEFMAERLGQVEIEDSDGEHADIVVCRLVTSPLLEPDNLVANCMKCFRMVQFRPYAPKKPPRLCDECAAPEMAKRAKNDELTMFITPRTASDVLAAIVKKRSN